jgi:LysM repeat protein
MLIDKDKPVYYVVQLGDNLYRIAKRNNLTLEELKALNPQ